MFKALLRALCTRRAPAAAPPPVAVAAARPPLAPPPEPPPSAEPCPADTIVELSACPVCGGSERTLVCRFNRFAIYEQPPDRHAGIYNYSLCHDCGMVYAARRPAGARYDWLFEHFEATLGRAEIEGDGAGKLAISSRALSDERRERLRRLAARGVFVSEHLGLSRKDYLPALFRDRAANSIHVDVIGSLIDLKAPRVLELRSRLGTIPAALKRLYGADSHAMAIFESQQFLIQEVYGIPAAWPIDFQHFTIAFEGQFDLIIANYMLTHVHRPAEFLSELHSRLSPGGYLYLYNETDEGDFLERGKAMIGALNPFHFQTFDRASMVRALALHGFTTEYLVLHDGAYICLAKKHAQAVPWTPLGGHERADRLAAYRRAWDISVIRMPEHARWQVAGEWDAVVERTVAAGVARITKQGEVRLAGKHGPV